MINNFECFLRNQLDNNKYIYTHTEGEIYRHWAGTTLDEALNNNNFVIVGEAFMDMDKGNMIDENDMFYLNTFKFYPKAVTEHNMVLDYSEHFQTRKIFLAFLENIILIEKHKRHPAKYKLETKSFYFGTTFYLRDDNIQPIALPYLTMKTPTGRVSFEFNYTKLLNVNEQITLINQTFREVYFKQVLDKTVTEMSDDEKKAVTMFYQ
jgi:hypothetical protein